MSLTAEQIKAAAMKLPPEERADLADWLWVSVIPREEVKAARMPKSPDASLKSTRDGRADPERRSVCKDRRETPQIRRVKHVWHPLAETEFDQALDYYAVHARHVGRQFATAPNRRSVFCMKTRYW